jgi:hypothetical protein
MHRCVLVVEKARARWRKFKALPVGKRFQKLHEQQKGAPAWVKPVLIAAAVLSLAAGIVLLFIPGPAFIFLGLAGALLAVCSARVARVLDRAEVGVRNLCTRHSPAAAWRRCTSAA